MRSVFFIVFVALLCGNARGQALDLSFGQGNGLVLPEPPSTENGEEPFTQMVQQSTGKVLVLTGRNGLSLRRFNLDGTVDETFGTNGMVPFVPYYTPENSKPPGLIVLDDDRFIIAYQLGNADYVFRRFSADGVLDLGFGTAFGQPGIKAYNYNPESISGGGLRPFKTVDNKIIFVGMRTVATPQFPSNGNRKIVVGKFDLEGNPDTTFNGNGFFSMLQTEQFPDPIVDFCISDGKMLLLAGNDKIYKLDYASGTIDNSLGDNGVVDLATNDKILRLFALEDGKYLFYQYIYPATTCQVSRRNADLSIDSSFGTDGFATLPVNITDMKQQSDGKLVFSGYPVGDTNDAVSYWLGVARLTQDGFLDDSESPGSYQLAIGPFGWSNGNQLMIQQDGKYLVGGTYKWREQPSIFGEKATYLLRLVPGPFLGTRSFENRNFGVYPNPFTDRIFISKSSGEAFDQIELYDGQGRLIQQFDPNEIVNSGEFESEIRPNQALSKGSYVLKIQTVTGTNQVFKVVKR